MKILEYLEKRLPGKGITVSRRGSGDDAFLYVTGNDRAVEISPDHKGVWIEYWDEANEEEIIDSVRNETITDPDKALDAVKEWLSPFEMSES